MCVVQCQPSHFSLLLKVSVFLKSAGCGLLFDLLLPAGTSDFMPGNVLSERLILCDLVVCSFSWLLAHKEVPFLKYSAPSPLDCYSAYISSLLSHRTITFICPLILYLRWQSWILCVLYNWDEYGGQWRAIRWWQSGWGRFARFAI